MEPRADLGLGRVWGLASRWTDGKFCPPWANASSHVGCSTGMILALVLLATVPDGMGEEGVMVAVSPGKSYEITYVRLKFHTSRPESFAIYKRSRADGPWVPFQFYSASCEKVGY